MPGKQPKLSKKEKKAQFLGIVKSANAIPDLISHLKMQKWTEFKKHGLDLKIESRNSESLSFEEMNDIFCLLKANMEQLYENTDWGWKDDVKLAELSHKDARYLIVRDLNRKIVGFSHFRFDVEQNLPILYCYELQIHDDYQRKGLGRHMMNILSLFAFEFKLLKIVLTVFKNNLVGINFYMNSLLFKKDATCPFAEEAKCYMILRKSIDKAEISAIKSA